MKKILDFKNKKNYMLYTLLGILVYLIAFTGYNAYKRSHSPQYKLETNMQEEINTKLNNKEYQKVVLAGGCFWCTESEFNHATGIISSVSGYADSDKENPTYEEVGSEKVKAREAVEVIYDPSLITFKSILEKYWKHIDPSDAEGQFADKGYSYTTAIYYTSPEQKDLAEKSKSKIEEVLKIKVATQILPFNNFYAAEEYHQDYKDKNPIRYNGYREGSGRNSYIRLHWQDGSTSTKAIFSTELETLNKGLNTENDMQNKNENKSWLNFTSKTKEEKLKTLTSLQYDVTQNEGTERAFAAGNLNTNKEVGIYVDIVSGEPLFLSEDKYDSGTGWPSFVKPINESLLNLHVDNGIFSTRTEVRSKIADSHLGHVFEDGPADRGGMRYCMNGAAMRFIKLEDMEKEGYSEYVNMLQ